MGMQLMKVHTSLYIRELCRGDPMNVMSVGGPTAGSQLSPTIREHTLGREPTCVTSVGKPFA